MLKLPPFRSVQHALAALLLGSLGVALMGLGARPASASVTTVISGTDLSGLDYRSSTGSTAEYVAGTPDVASLQTDDSGLNGDAPTVFVNASNAGLPSLGTLGAFSASYDLYSSSGGAGNAPYWLTYLIDPGGGYVGVISFGGPDLNGSSQIHVLCDYASPSCSNTYFGDTLAQLDSIAYGSTTFGQLAVYESGVEIGDWNISDTISASAEIQSITITAGVPEPASLTLFGAALVGLGFVRRKRARSL
jgi:PEP-CTERM motif